MLFSAIVFVLIFISGYELLHPDDHADPHAHVEVVELWPPPDPPPVPFGWQNNSIFEAATLSSDSIKHVETNRPASRR